MPASRFTLIDETERHPVTASIADGRVRLAPQVVAETLGWHLRDEGLCRGDVCIPVRDRSELVPESGEIDLEALSGALGRPLALEADCGAAALGASAPDRRTALGSLEAPDFALPDLGGQVHRLSDHRGKKVLLIAYASW